MQGFKEFYNLEEATKLTWDDQDDYVVSYYTTNQGEEYEITVRYYSETGSFTVSMEETTTYEMPIDDDFDSYKAAEKALKKVTKEANLNLPKESVIKALSQD